MLKRLFSTSFKKSSQDSKNNSIQGGIGVLFQVGPDKALYVKDITAGGSAEESRLLRIGDCLIEVDGKNVYQCDEKYVTGCVLGKTGTSVHTKR
jgi:C-terminal processing protease CtpA/Prc